MMKMGNLNIGQSTITITQAKEKTNFLGQRVLNSTTH